MCHSVKVDYYVKYGIYWLNRLINYYTDLYAEFDIWSKARLMARLDGCGWRTLRRWQERKQAYVPTYCSLMVTTQILTRHSWTIHTPTKYMFCATHLIWHTSNRASMWQCLACYSNSGQRKEISGSKRKERKSPRRLSGQSTVMHIFMCSLLS